jgi:hypothetical protein
LSAIADTNNASDVFLTSAIRRATRARFS